ncbi:MAG: hypothetical protein PUB21_11575 [Bacteroidales bacterium]|nr:hypothetical protein [Bacteroidales bacterium]
MDRYRGVIEEIRQVVESSFGCEVCSASRHFEVMQAKKAFVYIAMNSGYSQNMLARYIGCNRSTIYHLLRSANELMGFNRAFTCVVREAIKRVDLVLDGKVEILGR